jgi:Tfp pilus assembly protein PilF
MRGSPWIMVLAPALVAALAGCESAPVKGIQQEVKAVFEHHEGEPKLKAGIQDYQDAHYATAEKEFRASLDLGLATHDQVTAHKYLAFIYCVSGRKQLCRDEFRKALAVDPSFELDPGEAGHPIWGPVFREVKKGS